MTFQADFARERDRSKAYEIAFSEYLQTVRGYYILPTYDYSGLGDGKAPRLLKGKDGLVLPDLMGVKNGKISWFEIKLKSEATYYRKGGCLETGLNLRHWNDYQRVKAQIGAKIFIVFIHQKEDRVVTLDTDDFAAAFSHQYEDNKMGRGGMVFFDFAKLKFVMTASELERFIHETNE